MILIYLICIVFDISMYIYGVFFGGEIGNEIEKSESFLLYKKKWRRKKHEFSSAYSAHCSQIYTEIQLPVDYPQVWLMPSLRTWAMCNL